MSLVYSKFFRITSSKTISWRNNFERTMLRRMAKDPASNESIASRLKLLRKAVSEGDNQTAFAARVGVELKRWNNFERGKPLSKEIAILLVQRIPGLTLDWLYLGKADSLPGVLRNELEEAGKATSVAEGRGRNR
jgi:hypothetical protein